MKYNKAMLTTAVFALVSISTPLSANLKSALELIVVNAAKRSSSTRQH